MPPAARVTDPVTHGTPPVLGVGPGSPNVVIGGLPAWRGLTAAAAAALAAAVAEAAKAIAKATAAVALAPPGPATGAAVANQAKVTADQVAKLTHMIAGLAASGVDIHTCAAIIPPPVHGPGVVTTTPSRTVVINNNAACRMGDMITEANPLANAVPNMIAMGLPTVMIGD